MFKAILEKNFGGVQHFLNMDTGHLSFLHLKYKNSCSTLKNFGMGDGEFGIPPVMVLVG